MLWKILGSTKPDKSQKTARKMMIVLWDAKGILLKGYLPCGKTVNGLVDLLTKEILVRKIKDGIQLQFSFTSGQHTLSQSTACATSGQRFEY